MTIKFHCMNYHVEVREADVLGRHYFTVRNGDRGIACGYRVTIELCLSTATEAIAKHYAGREAEDKERIE